MRFVGKVNEMGDGVVSLFFTVVNKATDNCGTGHEIDQALE